MRQTKFTQEQVMFTLAMISYRGFQYLGEGRFSDERLRDAVEDALERLEPVKGQWELVWGPATYRAPFTLFADSAMYVVRSRKKPSRYVVAIRGTNPLSLFDWVFGDLLTGKVTPWRYGNSAAFPKAAISLSTSLGLSILQNLRSSPPSRGLLADIWRLVDRNLVDPLSEIARNVVRPLGAVLEDAFLRLRGGFQQDLRALAARDRPASTDLDVAIEAIRSERRSRLRKRIRREIAKTLKKGSGSNAAYGRSARKKKKPVEDIVLTEIAPKAATAEEALSRIEIPKDIRTRVAEMLTPGSSLAVTNDGISRETTPKGSDFIVLMQ